MITFKIVTFAESAYKLEELFKDHYNEIGYLDFKLDFSINYTLYLAMEAGNRYLCGTFIDTETDKIVGYISILIYNALHTTGLYANTDAIYLKPEYRGKSGKAILQAFKLLDKELIKRNVSILSITGSIKHNLNNLAAHLGFKEAEIVYSKQLK